MMMIFLVLKINKNIIITFHRACIDIYIDIYLICSYLYYPLLFFWIQQQFSSFLFLLFLFKFLYIWYFIIFSSRLIFISSFPPLALNPTNNVINHLFFCFVDFIILDYFFFFSTNSINPVSLFSSVLTLYWNNLLSQYYI